MLNGAKVTNLPAREDGLIAVPVSQGPIALTVDWTATRDVIIGRGERRRWHSSQC